MLKVAKEPYTYKYTSDDLEALKPFIAHLRNSLILDQEESDARTPEGAVTYPLSTEHVRKKIKTDPTLRYLWKRLTPAQQAYAENRYVQNTPTRYETMESMTPNPFAAPLEHDYHLTHNPVSYRSGRVIQSSALGLTQPGAKAGIVGNLISKPVGLIADAVTSRLPGAVHTSGTADGDVSGDAKVALERGGYRQTSAPMANQPHGAAQRVVENTVHMAAPIAADVIAFKRLAAILPQGSAWASAADTVSQFQNPFNIFAHPVKWWRSPGLFANKFPRVATASKFLDLYGDTSHLYDIASATLGSAEEAESNQRAHDVQVAGALDDTRFGGSKDPQKRAQIQREKESSQQVTREAENPQQQSTILDWLSNYKTHGVGALIGGGLGVALDRRSRLRGFLVGSLLGAAAPALYNYVKKRYS